MSQVTSNDNKIALELCDRAVRNANGDRSAFHGAFALLKELGKQEGALAEYSSEAIQRGLEVLLKSQALLIAGEILASYRHDRHSRLNGCAALVLPAGVGVIEGLEALGEYFRLKVPRYGRGAVDPELLTWLKGLTPNDLSSQFENDPKTLQEIIVTPLSHLTRQCSRDRQQERLEDKRVRFAAPGDQALIAAAHACLHNGEDIFRGCIVRGKIAGKAIGHDSDRGIALFDCPDDAEQLGDDRSLHDIDASSAPR